MKKSALLASVIAIYLVPSVAFAAWWNPLSWGIWHAWFSPRAQSEGVSQGVSLSHATSTATSTAADASSTLPTRADLYARIALLENKLQSVETTAKAPAPAPVARTSAPSAPASDEDALRAYAPAIALVSTATSSGSGAFIDASGDILVPAHAVWTKDQSGAIVGPAESVTVTLANGTEEQGTVVGMDEAPDLALVHVSSGASPAYLRSDLVPIVGAGDTVYVFGYPTTQADPALGYGFVPAIASSQSDGTVAAVSDRKPIDQGGAMVTAKGTLIGIPRIDSCKVLEDMTTCLKYNLAASSYQSILPELEAGMFLYVNKAYHTDDETLVKSELGSIHDSIANSSILSYAVRNVTGDNSFDAFNGKLSNDQDGRVTRAYLTKLKIAADGMAQAMDFLKSQAEALNLFFEENTAAISGLGRYEQSIVAKIQAENAAKLAEYSQKLDYWSSKEHEYDGYLADQTGTTHDYLMLEGVSLENAADYITAETNRFESQLSGENVAIF